MARGTRRDLKKEVFWRRVVRGQVGSGLSIRAWCRRHGVRESAFYWWRRRLARRAAAAPRLTPVRVVADTVGDAAATPFTPVQVVAEMPSGEAASGASGRIEIVLPGARRVHVIGHVARQTLADVLGVLAGLVEAEAATGYSACEAKAAGQAERESGRGAWLVREVRGC